MSKTKEIKGGWKLVYEKERVAIVDSDDGETLGNVFVWHSCETVVDLTDTDFVLRVEVVNEAAQFLQECLEAEKYEAMSKFKCEVEYTFKHTRPNEILVCLGETKWSISRSGSDDYWLPPAVVAAARKFAGWDK